MFLFTKTAVIKSDLQRIILLLMCFTVYLSNTYSCIFSANLYLYFIYRPYAQIKLLVLRLNPLKGTRNHCTILGLLILDLYYSL